MLGATASDGRSHPFRPGVLSLMRIKNKKKFCKVLHFVFHIVDLKDTMF